jgi:hypothetical protein
MKDTQFILMLFLLIGSHALTFTLAFIIAMRKINKKWEEAIETVRKMLFENNYIIPKSEIEKWKNLFFSEED